MKVVCQKCLSVYSVKDESVPDSGTEARCPKCHHMISLSRRHDPEPVGSDRDYGKTMVLFVPLPAQQEEQLQEVQVGLKGEKERIPTGQKILLSVIEGEEMGREYVVSKSRTVIGRSRADILVNDPEVSRQHAALEVYGDKMVIKDLGSTNGTFLNRLGVRLSYVKDGDEIQVGNTRFRLAVR